jgi:hypothetical protein
MISPCLLSLLLKSSHFIPFLLLEAFHGLPFFSAGFARAGQRRSTWFDSGREVVYVVGGFPWFPHSWCIYKIYMQSSKTFLQCDWGWGKRNRSSTVYICMPSSEWHGNQIWDGCIPLIVYVLYTDPIK